MIWDEFLMDNVSFMNVIETDSNLKETIQYSFGVHVLIFVFKKSTWDPIPKSFSFQLLQKHNPPPLNVVCFKCLSNVNMISDIYPLFHFFFHRFFLLSAHDLFKAIRWKNWILLFQNRVWWRIQFEEGAFVKNRFLSIWSLHYFKNTLVLFVEFFFFELAKFSWSSSYSNCSATCFLEKYQEYWDFIPSEKVCDLPSFHLLERV